MPGQRPACDIQENKGSLKKSWPVCQSGSPPWPWGSANTPTRAQFLGACSHQTGSWLHNLIANNSKPV